MSEYTVTFPVHLGQKVWVDSRILPTNEIQPDCIKSYLTGEVRALIIQTKGDTDRKSLKIRIESNWLDKSLNKFFKDYKYFKVSVSAIGKTIFDKEPDDETD